MIVKTEAIEPKSSSATAVYLAVVLDKSDNEFSAFVNLQYFCPEVMSGSLADAKFSLNNWVEAPKQITKDIGYDFEVGCIITISFQNGNLNSPQFVNYIPIENNALTYNQYIIEKGIDPAADSGIYDNIMDEFITLNSPGLKKGIALLPVLERYADVNNPIHLYAYDGFGYGKSGHNILTIYKCGKYGTEFICNQHKDIIDFDTNNTFAMTQGYNFDFLDENGSSDNENSKDKPIDVYNNYKFKFIIKFLYNVYGDKIVDIANSVLHDGDEHLETTSKFNFNKFKNADIAYLYTNLAGYFCQMTTYDNKRDKYDKTYVVSTELSKTLAQENAVVSMPEEKDAKMNEVMFANYNELMGSAEGLSATNFYHAGLLYDDKNFTVDFNDKDTVFKFIRLLWKRLHENQEFNDLLASRYAMILSSYLMYFKSESNYNITSTSNITLIILVTLSTSFPILYGSLKSKEDDNGLISNTRFGEDLKLFKENINKCIEDSSNQEILKYSADELAENFKNLYFCLLDWDVRDSKIANLFSTDFGESPNKIKELMKSGIQYIFDNKDSLLESIKDVTVSNSPNTSLNNISVSLGDNPITLTWIKQNCSSRADVLSVFCPVYKNYCGLVNDVMGDRIIKYPGVLALQVFYEVNSQFPQKTSPVCEADNNLGGLKYSSAIPNATRGSKVPQNETGGNYCHFNNVSEYIYAHVWNIRHNGSYFSKALNSQSSVESFTRELCKMWVTGGISVPTDYVDFILQSYAKYNLSQYEN